jgi:hypothetical protein
MPTLESSASVMNQAFYSADTADESKSKEHAIWYLGGFKHSAQLQVVLRP